MERTTLWRLTWSHARGVYWLAMRVCDTYNADAWLSQFERDEPNAVYMLSAKRPKIKAGDEARALHPASFA